MLRSLACCCAGRSSQHERLEASYDFLDDEDLLLPGGELLWDKSSKSFVKSTSKTKTSRHGYVPPKVPNSANEDSNPIMLPVIEDFKLLKTVGKGAFGKVIMAVHTSTRTLYAIKIVPKVKIATQKQIRQIVTEVEILKKVKHPFCVSLQFAFQNDDCLFYVFEFAAGGMLFYHLREEGRFNESKARFYIGEIILALEYLHGFGIIFRDLKPENCMLSAIGHILLTDFGSAKELTRGEKTATLAGTPHYMAPEVLRGEPYNYSADWWSCGIILYEMLVGKTPFNSGDRLELYRTILKCTFKMPSHLSLRARSLLYMLIERDPEGRLGYTDDMERAASASKIKQHSFFSSMEMTSEEESQLIREEANYQRSTTDTRSRRRGLSNESFSHMTGSIKRRLSSTGRMMGRSHCTPCEWRWVELAEQEINPPFRPKLTRPTDCSYFDPVMTTVPPTISDFTGSISSGRIIKVEGFDYCAPDDLPLEEEEEQQQQRQGQLN